MPNALWPLSTLAWEATCFQKPEPFPTSSGAGLAEAKPAACSEGWSGAGSAMRPSGKQGAHFVVSEEKLLSDGMLVEAREASDEDLLVVHTRRYLNELKVQGLGPGEGC